jgi:serine/threonine-protein kinase
MELLDGVTVEALGKGLGGRFPIREALAVTHQLLDVLTVAHESAVIHRDIKPANLFVSMQGDVKVLDFGIARLRDAAAGVHSTRAGAILGTPSFMAPEQALAEGDEIDPRTDVWSAGASLFNMISGRFVHEGDNSRQLMIRAATAPARSLADVVPDAPAAVVEVVAKALAFEKSARWESAAAMREAIARIHEELFGAIAREHLKACVEQAPRRVERVRAEPWRGDASPVRATENVNVAPPVGTAADSPDARRRGAASDVATTTSRPVANRRTEGRARRTRSAVVVALVGTALGLSATGLVMKRARDSLEAHAMLGASKPPSPPLPATLPPQTLTGTEFSPASPTAGASAVVAAQSIGVAAPPPSPSPASMPGPRIASSPGVPASTGAKAKAIRSAPSADSPKRDPLHIELQ